MEERTDQSAVSGKAQREQPATLSPLRGRAQSSPWRPPPSRSAPFSGSAPLARSPAPAARITDDNWQANMPGGSERNRSTRRARFEAAAILLSCRNCKNFRCVYRQKLKFCSFSPQLSFRSKPGSIY